MNVITQFAVNQTIQIVTRELLNFVEPEKRQALAFAIADSTVDTAAVVTSIFTASATKEIFGWGRNFNVSKSVARQEPIRSLLLKAENETSPLDTTQFMHPEYTSWPT